MERAQPHLLNTSHHRHHCARSHRVGLMGATDKRNTVRSGRVQNPVWITCFAFGIPLFSRALRFGATLLRIPLPLHRTMIRLRRANSVARLEGVKSKEEALVSCGGGGTFFFWQLGAARAIAERRAGRRTIWAGTSAGALCAALTLCEVDPYTAVTTAHRLAEEKGLYTRKGGLFGVWGVTIRQWLEELLPEDAAHRCGNGILYVQVTVWKGWFTGGLRVKRISTFETRTALIDTLMASIHIPYFLDGRLFARSPQDYFSCDGSILHFIPGKRLLFGVTNDQLRVTCENGRIPDYFISHMTDNSFDNGGPGFADLLTFECAINLMHRGYSFTNNRLDGGSDGASDDGSDGGGGDMNTSEFVVTNT